MKIARYRAIPLDGQDTGAKLCHRRSPKPLWRDDSIFIFQGTYLSSERWNPSLWVSWLVTQCCRPVRWVRLHLVAISGQSPAPQPSSQAHVLLYNPRSCVFCNLRNYGPKIQFVKYTKLLSSLGSRISLKGVCVWIRESDLFSACES